MYGPWQVGNITATEYTARARTWSHALKLVDPSIILIGCGWDGINDWDREVVQGLTGFVEQHAIHTYTAHGERPGKPLRDSFPGYTYEKNVFGPAAPERQIEITHALIDLANTTPGKGNSRTQAAPMTVAFDEWNVWDDSVAIAEVGLEQEYTYTDMLGMAAWLNVLLRKHHNLGMACMAQSVNAISPVMTRPDGMLLQPTYYPLQLFSKYMKGGRLLQLPVQPDR